MAEIAFADRYAEIGLAPKAETIAARLAPTNRIIADCPTTHLLAAAQTYFGISGADLEWLRTEYHTDDITFSLVNNEREVRLICAVILDALVDAKDHLAILSIVSGYSAGQRKPAEFEWLVSKAQTALLTNASAERVAKKIDPNVAAPATPKITEEIAAIQNNDWAGLLEILGKIRTEAFNSARTTSAQATKALTEMDRQIRLQREENQMLWWIVGGHSRSLTRSFGEFTSPQTAIIAAIDLADLTVASELGPVAAGAMLERMIALSAPSEGAAVKSLGTMIESIDNADLQKLDFSKKIAQPAISVVSTALELAKTLGVGAWQNRFNDLTGLSANVEISPFKISELLYYERLLGKLL